MIRIVAKFFYYYYYCYYYYYYYYYLIELKMNFYSVAVVLQYDTSHKYTYHTK
jgi:hypothetical protein